MKERLTELVLDGYLASQRDGNFCADVADIADYLLANGVIVPPVKVGQMVWCIIEKEQPVFCNGVNVFYKIYEKNVIVECEVYSIRMCRDVDAQSIIWDIEVIGLVKDKHGCYAMFTLMFYDICKENKVFTTQEEAERALAERQAE